MAKRAASNGRVRQRTTGSAAARSTRRAKKSATRKAPKKKAPPNGSTATRDGVRFPREWLPLVRTAADVQALREGCTVDFSKAEKVREFFEKLLRHSKGKFAGKPFELATWQWERVVLPAFAWRRPDGRRRFRKAYIEIPKKNGKSTLCSGLALWHLFEEAGAEVYLCAADRDQAKIVFNEAASMVKKSQALESHLRVFRGYHEIRREAADSKIEAISSDADSAEGKNASAMIFDELHAWPGREFYESLMYAGAAREQPFIWQITTAGDDLTSICYEEHERARRILADEDLSTDYLAVLYGADPDDDWTSLDVWRKANPSLGETIDEASVLSDIKEAKSQPSKIPALKRYRLNIWIGATTAWLDVPTFKRAQRPKLSRGTFPRRSIEEYGAVLERIAKMPYRAGGLDLARVADTASLVWGGEDDDGQTLFAERFWLPGDLVEQRAREWKLPLSTYVEAGWIELTEGDVIDYGAIRAAVVADSAVVRPGEVGYDEWNAELLCNQLLRIADGVPTVAVPQTFAGMAEASKEFEARLRAKKVEVSASPFLAWQAGNVVTATDQNDNIRPVKRRSKGKIDGIVALIIALSRLLERQAPPGTFYEENPVEFI